MSGCRHHSRFTEGCRVCWLARYSRAYRNAWGIAGEPERVPEGSTFRLPEPVIPPPPCDHLGESLTGKQREAAGLDHRLDWRHCELGYSAPEAPAGVVCRCRNCGPRCPGYRVDPANGDG